MSGEFDDPVSDTQRADERLSARIMFDVKPKLDKAATAEAGRPVHRDVPYLTITLDAKATHCRPVRMVPNVQRCEKAGKGHIQRREDETQTRFATGVYYDENPELFDYADDPRWESRFRRWAAGMQGLTRGTSLGEWNGCTPSQRMSLLNFQVSTLEQLAEISDGDCTLLGMGYLALREKAKLYIQNAGTTAGAERLAGELSKRDAEIALLKSQMQQLIDAQKAQQMPERPKEKQR